MLRFEICCWLNTVIEIGTSCSRSSTRRAVTMMSPPSPVPRSTARSLRVPASAAGLAGLASTEVATGGASGGVADEAAVCANAGAEAIDASPLVTSSATLYDVSINPLLSPVPQLCGRPTQC